MKSLPTSREVYSRIKWDPSLDASRFSLCWRQRDGELAEVPFLEWREDVIPWHRVERFMRERECVWDRDRRIDLVISATAPQAPAEDAEAGGALGAPGVQRIPTWRWERSRWIKAKPGTLSASQQPERLRVATYNVLFDSFARLHVDVELRRAAIFAMLEELEADVLALQEVEPDFLSALLSQDWVRAQYVSSGGPAARSVTPYGQVILSRWPMTCASHMFSRQKRVIFADVLVGERIYHVAALHLTSSRAKNAPEKRAEQITRLLALTQSARDVLLLGDFNLSEQEQVGTFEVAGFVDAWSHLRAGEQGATFETQHNSMAAITATQERGARFDRVLAKLAQGDVIGVEHFGQQRLVGGLNLSDHWGVLATLRTGKGGALLAAPIVRSAAVLIPPARCLPAIQQLRAQHDRRRMERWMPHITLLYPFAPERHFDEAAALLEQQARLLEPFRVRLGELDTFDHAASTTVWAACESEDSALEALQQALEREPWTRQSELGAHGYTPHLTLGALKGEGLREVLEECRAQWTPQEFWCTEIALISRRDEQPFEVRRVIPLGGGMLASKILEDELFGHASEQGLQEQGVALVRALMPGHEVMLVGSRSLAGALPGADIDVMMRGSGSVEASLGQLARALGACAQVADVVWVQQSKQPVVRARMRSGVWLDVQAATRGGEDALSVAAEQSLEVARAMASLAASVGAQQVFGESVRWVKLWAQRRGISGAAFGFWPGVAWAAMCCWAVQEVARGSAVTLERVLAKVFTFLGSWEGETVAGMWDGRARFDGLGDWLPVVAPGVPQLNLGRGMSTTTAQLMREEFERAAKLVRLARARQTSWRELLEAAGHHDEVAHVWVSASAPSEQGLERAQGALRGRVMKLVLDIEQYTSLLPRPWPQPQREGERLRWRVDVAGLRERQHALLYELLEDFVQRLEEPEVVWEVGVEPLRR